MKSSIKSTRFQNWVSSAAVRHKGLASRLARDEGGQSLLVGVLCILLLVMMLTVIANLSFAVYEKMQAQNAADAAALTAGIWQVRGLHFVQEMNNAIYVADTASAAFLGIAGICGPLTASPAVGVAQLAGNAAIVLFVAVNGISHFGLCPLRWVAASGFPVVAYMGASSMALANNSGTSVFAAGNMAVDMGSEYLDNWFKQFLGDNVYNLLNGMLSNLPKKDPSDPSGDTDPLWKALSGLAQHVGAIGFEFQLDKSEDNAVLAAFGDDAVKPVTLHLEWNKGEDPKGLPLKADKLFVDPLKTLAQPLAFSWFLNGYLGGVQNFHDVEGIWCKNNNSYWNHGWYATKAMENPDKETKFAVLPTSTWMAMCKAKDDVYRRRTSAWRRMGGLGVRQFDGTYGDMGRMALASVKVVTDKVACTRFSGTRGWVRLVPVKLFKTEEDSLSIGICH